jgi:4-amino-4-deoxy-L-arabinose transferase-like glycosyltransferase
MRIKESNVLLQILCRRREKNKVISIRAALVSFLSGVLLVVSWTLFIDGQTQSHDAFVGTFVLPPLAATFAAIMVNLVSVKQVAKNNAVKVWLFIWVTVHLICVGASIYILTKSFAPDDNYAGITILLQTVIVMFAGMLFFVGRFSPSPQDSSNPLDDF